MVVDPIGDGTRLLRAAARRLRLSRHRWVTVIEWVIPFAVIAILYWFSRQQ